MIGVYLIPQEMFNNGDTRLRPNTSDTHRILGGMDILSNGFKIKIMVLEIMDFETQFSGEQPDFSTNARLK